MADLSKAPSNAAVCCWASMIKSRSPSEVHDWLGTCHYEKSPTRRFSGFVRSPQGNYPPTVIEQMFCSFLLRILFFSHNMLT
jgi:hypothetical protein